MSTDNPYLLTSDITPKLNQSLTRVDYSKVATHCWTEQNHMDPRMSSGQPVQPNGVKWFVFTIP